MSNILALAKKDWKRFSQSSFDLDLNFSTPDGGQTATIKGIGTRAQTTFRTDGTDAIGDLVHISFNEELLSEANVAYPIRNAKGLVAMNEHLVSFLDSTGTLRNYQLKQVYPDSAVGMIAADCADYTI